ncbi:MAG: hypothetical protein LBU43_12025 [Candidatus Accumulibacter sp.]|nr:hypothetical protein [Accumulibacter sp.]
MGRLVVFSALGQPLRAEIEVTATRQELTDMKARLAPPEAFRQVGLDYATSLLSLRFSLDRRPNGQAVIKLSSERPINDPFLDMLLELNWATGRLVREFTFLLDPPEYTAKAPVSTASPVIVDTPEVVSTPLAAPNIPPTAVSPLVESGTSIGGDVRARAIAQIQGQQAGAEPPVAQSPAGTAPRVGEGREVKRGDTLHRIATETRLEGVSLDQMLVGLLRANPGAFDGGNMNRLRSGAILSIPEKSALESVSATEARKVVVAQSADWNTYRGKLAGVAAASPVPAKGSAAGQESGGKITAKVDDKIAPTSPRDRVTLSTAAPVSGRGGTAAARVSDEDLVAREKALKEANTRVAALEKNVSDLQKLLELKNQSLADLQKQVSAKPAAAAPTPVASFPEPLPAPKSVEPAPAPLPVPESVEPATAPMPAPKSVELAPVKAEPLPPPVQPAAKPESKPAAPRPRPVTPPPPPPEPGFFEELFDNPMLLAGGGGAVLALIAGYLFMRRRRAMADVEPDVNSTLTAESTTTSVMDSSVFHQTGGQSVDTSQALAQTDFSQVGPGNIDTDEVDPVAEADVYMAYGRDTQAEEILLEARQKDPKRLAITVKLLEVYSGRKDLKQFETLAASLYSETGGVGTDWDKAAAMGRALDHNNPLFRGGAAAANAAKAAPAASAGLSAPVAAPPPAPPVAAPATKVPPASPPEATALDFAPPPPPASPQPAPAVKPTAVRPPEAPKPTVAAASPNDATSLDFDIGTKIVAPLPEASGQQENRQEPKANPEHTDLDFDLGGATLVPQDYDKTDGEPEAPLDKQELGDDAVEFDVSLTESTFLGRMPTEPPSVDISSISLDLHSPDLEIVGLETQPSAQAPQKQAVAKQTSSNDRIATATDPVMQQMENVVSPPLSFPELSGQDDAAANSSPELMETQVDIEMPATLTDSEFNLDFANQTAETVISPLRSSEQEPGSELDVDANEEVATKLDLAKAYEEMGDIEGARELLQEVLKDGNASQRETAQSLLDKVGG